MGRQATSWKDVGGSGGGGASWLDSWKKAGFLKVVLHPEPPWIRRLHNFRKLEETEERGGLVKSVKWFPFSCWEEDEYHRLRRFERDSSLPAAYCPGCRFLEHLEQRDDIADDAVVFKFQGSGRGETRELLKVDLLGNGKSKRSYQDDFSARPEYVMAVIALDHLDQGVCLTNEKWSLGKALRKRIETDIKIHGEEAGDPSKNPVAYTFEYDEQSQTYAVSALDAEISPQVRELWESPAPDGSKYVRRGNPKALLEAFEKSAQIQLPLSEIFAPALAAFAETEETEGTDFDPADYQGDTAPEKTPPKASKSAPKPETKAKPETKSKSAPAKAESKKEEPKAATPAKPQRPTRATKAPEPEPEPPEETTEEEPAEDIFECSSCGADWPASLPECPSCGAVAADDAPNEEAPEEVEEEEPPPPPPAESKASTAKSKATPPAKGKAPPPGKATQGKVGADGFPF